MRSFFHGIYTFKIQNGILVEHAGHKLFSDEELVKQFKKGDERPLRLSIPVTLPAEKGDFYIFNDYEDVEDVFHDVTENRSSHRPFNMAMAFSSWAYQIAINCSKNHIKKNRKGEIIIEREKFRLMAAPSGSPSPEDAYLTENDLKEFNRAVDSLDDKFREVFLFRYDHNMRYSRISEILKCSERTAKWRMKKAVEKIAQYLKEKDVI
jgi:RNA polymerase sigma-70 factor (ECF subfamily)